MLLSEKDITIVLVGDKYKSSRAMWVTAAGHLLRGTVDNSVTFVHLRPELIGVDNPYNDKYFAAFSAESIALVAAHDLTYYRDLAAAHRG
jgi:hypothetical protein